MTPSEINDTTKAALEVIKIIGETIAETGDVGMPSGLLYAALMSYGISFGAYNQIIGMLKAAGLVTEEAFVIRWVGGPL